MSAGEPLSTSGAEPRALSTHAIDNLRYIRRTLESSGAFTSVPGRGGMAMGIVALAAAFAAGRAGWDRHWLEIWVGAAAVAALVGGVAMWRKARGCGQRLSRGVGRRFLLGLAPPIAAAVALTAVLSDAGLAGAIPGVWLLLYGVAVLGAGAFSVPPVPLLGASFMALGLAAFVAPAAWANALLGLGFGGLHLLFGWLIARLHGG